MAQTSGPEGFGDDDLWVGVAPHEGVDEPAASAGPVHDVGPPGL
ncbi:hypothetical protein SGL43_03077 [Streptomyces globisporus]|uniref:Uncharacterized protein n=1 Tax=Streptomyces globisporus TaxID=1908 RepID=A0ABN8V0L9_STRGL|nr:hypothetical protein SGL43_03077 [Streptomyces globisporus]